MTPPTLVTASAVRQYLNLNDPATGNDSRYTDQTMGSNIRAAGAWLERRTGRFYGDQTLTLKFTTNGQALVILPGLRTATSVTLAGATLTADSTYYLVPDTQQSGVYTGIQFRAFQNRQSRGPWYMANPEWFDRGLDLPGQGSVGYTSSLPNDLVIAGSFGYTDALLPEEVRHAVKVLAGYYTKRPDALLSGGVTTDSGSFDLSAYPIEVQDFVRDWATGSFVTGTG